MPDFFVAYPSIGNRGIFVVLAIPDREPFNCARTLQMHCIIFKGLTLLIEDNNRDAGKNRAICLIYARPAKLVISCNNNLFLVYYVNRRGFLQAGTGGYKRW